MAEQRLIIEMGQGLDLHGRDATKAACRAVEDAMRGSSLPIFGTTGLSREDMRIVVHIAAPDPDAVDAARVAKVLPYGTPDVQLRPGGMVVGDGPDPVLMVMAAVEVFLPRQTGWRLSG